MKRDYRILCENTYLPHQIELELIEGQKVYPKGIQRRIDKAWTEALKDSSKRLFNGRVAGLQSWQANPQKLSIQVIETDYKSFYGTNVINGNVLSDAKDRADALAVCAVVQTLDACIIVGKRNTALAEGSGFWHVPGGTLEFPTADKTSDRYTRFLGLPDCRASLLNPLATMLRELHEEFNLEPEMFGSCYCLGMGENLLMRKPEFLCHFNIKLNSWQIEQLRQAAPDADEHSEVCYVPLEEIMDFIHEVAFAPIGKAAIELFLQSTIDPAAEIPF